MPRHKHAMLALACFQNFTCGGLLFGWAAIASSMLAAPIEKGGAALTGDHSHSIFVIGSTVNFVSPLILGVVLDSMGPKACSALSLFFVGAGTYLFGKSGPGLDTFTLGMALVAFGGPGVQSAIIHISNLYPTKKATATSVITGSFSLSFVIFLVFNSLWENFGWTYSDIFIAYSGVVAVCFVLTLFFMPNKPYTLKAELRREIEEEPQKALQFAGKTSEDFELSKVRMPSVYKKVPGLDRVPSIAFYPSQGRPLVPGTPRRTLKEESLVKQLKSGAFFRVTVLLVVASFWANFYIGVLNTQLGDEGYLESGAQDFCVSIFTAITTGGVLGIPIVGAMMDGPGFPTTALVTVVLGLLWCVGVLLKMEYALLGAFVAYALFRTFLFTYFFGYLGDTLGFRFFGILSGASFAVAGVVGLLQYPLSDWGTGNCHLEQTVGCDPGNWPSVNNIQLACFLCLLFVPLYDFRKSDSDSGMKASRVMDSPIVNRKLLERLQRPPADSESAPLRSNPQLSYN